MAQLVHMRILSIEDLEESLGVSRFRDFILHSEERFQKQLAKVVRRVTEDLAIQAVFVSGPTSSGKTTFSRRLAEAVRDSGRLARVVSLDDYYKVDSVRYDAWGRPDFESLDTLETDLMASQLADLLQGKTIILPRFDFVTRTRSMPVENELTLGTGDLLIVEGLHGLHDSIVGHLPRQAWLGVFIMPWCSLLDGRQLLGSRDLRMLRRISRDVVHRGSTALSTIDYWPMIDQTEQQFFPQYLKQADVYINSCLDYEFCIVAPKAYHHILSSLQEYEDETLPASIYIRPTHALGYADLDSAVAEARHLVAACEHIPMVDHFEIPDQSILHEFI